MATDAPILSSLFHEERLPNVSVDIFKRPRVHEAVILRFSMFFPPCRHHFLKQSVHRRSVFKLNGQNATSGFVWISDLFMNEGLKKFTLQQHDRGSITNLHSQSLVIRKFLVKTKSKCRKKLARFLHINNGKIGVNGFDHKG